MKKKVFGLLAGTAALLLMSGNTMAEDGWNEMTKDLGEIKELARTMRAQH